MIVGPKTIDIPGHGSQGQPTTMGEPGIGGPLLSSKVVDLAITTTIADQVITTAPTALVIAGTTATLTPGAPALTINGTLVSLNTAAQLILGSKTVSLPGSNAQTTDLSALIMKAFGPGRPFNSSAWPSLAGGNNSLNDGGSVNGPSMSGAVGVKVFRGDGGARLRKRRSRSWKSWMMVEMAAVVYGWVVCRINVKWVLMDR